MSTRAKFWFDHKTANKYCRFIENHLRLTEGEARGRRFRLARWQRRIVRRLFGWKRQDGTRRYRQAWIEIPRKNGKSEFAAALALALLLIDGEGSPQVYCAAVDKDQAKIVFNKAAVMAATSKTVSQKVEVLKTSIFVPTTNGGLKPLSSVASTKHGLSPSGVVYDEVHEMPDGELMDVIHKGTGARRQPLEIYITTAGIKGDNIACEMHDYAMDVAAGRIQDDAYFVAIFAANDNDDWKSPATWRKANPNLGVSLKLSYLEEECQKAQQSLRAENDFRRFHLNQWVSQAVRWLQMDRWDACTQHPEDPEYWKKLRWLLASGAFKKRPAFAGLDLAQSGDITAFVLDLPPVAPGERAIVIPFFWLPELAIEKASSVQARKYQDWRQQEAITFTAGEVTDYEFVQEQIVGVTDKVDLKMIGYDPYNASTVAQHLQSRGVKLEIMRQGIPTMGPPSKELERQVEGRMLEHGGHPVLRWMADNVEVIPDINGNIMPRKGTSAKQGRRANKIDGITALVMAEGQRMANPGPRLLDISKWKLTAS